MEELNYQQKIKKVAAEHANYLCRMANGNIWGSKLDKMYEDIVNRHTVNQTPEKELDRLILEYEQLKK
jgi:hypothetical protein